MNTLLINYTMFYHNYLTKICNVLVKYFKVRNEFITKHCSMVEVWYKDNNKHVLWRLKEVLPMVDAMDFYLSEVANCKYHCDDHSYMLICLKDNKVLSTYKTSIHNLAVPHVTCTADTCELKVS